MKRVADEHEASRKQARAKLNDHHNRCEQNADKKRPTLFWTIEVKMMAVMVMFVVMLMRVMRVVFVVMQQRFMFMGAWKRRRFQ
jgi:hypothetical protein